MKKSSWVLWGVFAVMFIIRVLFPDTKLWIVLAVTASILAIVLLKKNGMPTRKYVILSIAFAVLATVAYLGYQRNPFILLYGLTAGIPTLLTSLAVFGVMKKKGGYALLSRKKKYSAVVSVAIALLVGAVLSVVNIVLSGEEPVFQFSLWKLLLCFNPAIFEEMACRAIFMAYGIYFSAHEKMKATDVFTMYFMMCVPHTVAHGYRIIETVVLCLLFGLPFAVLQRKRDITSAMISHGLVDAVRFTLLGS